MENSSDRPGQEQSLSSTEKSDLLLDALIAYVDTKIEGEVFVEWVHDAVDAALDAAAVLTLGDVVSASQVRSTAIKYFLEWRLEDTLVDALAELTSEIQRHYVEYRTGPVPNDVDSDESLKEIIVRLESLPAFQRISSAVYGSEFVKRTVAALVYQSATDVLRADASDTELFPGQAALKRLTGGVAGRIVPELAQQRADELLRTAADYLAARTASDSIDSPDAARHLASALIGAIDAQDFSRLTTAVTSSDIEDFFVVSTHVIRDVRATMPLRTALEIGINVFFEKYSDHTLADLLTILGITRADMIEETLRFAPRAIRAVERKGLVDRILRKNFRDFVDSPEVLALLAK